MKISVAICYAIILCSTYVSGQTIPFDQNKKEHVIVMIHKQSGEIIPPDDLYNYFQYGGSIYTFKISGDTTYQYFDEDPPEDFTAYFNSLLSEKLNTTGIIDSVQDLEGDIYLKTELKNKVLVLNFWATWCGPCVKEMTELNRLVDTYLGKEVLFFAPTREVNSPRLVDFLFNREFKYKIVPNADGISSEFRVLALPTHVVIDRNGIVRFIQAGADTETIYEILSSEIEKYL